MREDGQSSASYLALSEVRPYVPLLLFFFVLTAAIGAMAHFLGVTEAVIIFLAFLVVVPWLIPAISYFEFSSPKLNNPMNWEGKKVPLVGWMMINAVEWFVAILGFFVGWSLIT